MQLLFRRISSNRKVSFFKLCSDCLPRLYTMTEGHKKISSFFTPLAQKRGNVESDEKETKKQKLETTPTKKNVVQDRENTPEPQHTTSPLGSHALSPEQKARIEENKNTAKLKIIEKQTGGLVTNIGLTWFQALEPEFSKPYFSSLCKFVNEERKNCQIFPPVNEVFSWTTMGNIKDVKVVILGQDPYHGPRQAHGLCFSVQKGVKIPPSLENMYKELQNDIEGFKHPGHGYLTGWAKQGVLLLNACLTVKAHQANSHKDKGWEKFTDSVVSWLNKNRSDVVFILWGAYAQKKGAYINKEKHHVIKGPHPSPLSAHRGFFGCKHFSQCNKLLTDQGKAPIDWTDLPPQE